MQDVVSLLTHRAIPAGKLDAEAARQQLEATGSQPADGPGARTAREQAIAQAEAQLRVASKATIRRG